MKALLQGLIDLLVPAAAKQKVAAAADYLLGVLQGEPARVIGYGAAVIVYVVANASGRIPDVSFDQAVGDAGAAIVLLVSVVESIRHFVSPASA